MRLLIALFIGLGMAFSYASPADHKGAEVFHFDSAKKEAQFRYLLKDLRCLVCQNQDLADSNAELARDLRMQAYHLVKEGKSDEEIKTYFTARYGDFILFKPPLKGITVLLWFGPCLFLLLGFWVFWITCFKRSAYD